MTRRVVYTADDIDDPIILRWGSDYGLLDGDTGELVLYAFDDVMISTSQPERAFDIVELLSEEEWDGADWDEVADLAYQRINS